MTNLKLISAAVINIWKEVDLKNPDCRTSGICTPEDIGYLASSVAQTALALVGTISLLFLVIAGITYITSGGNPEKIEKAKSGIFYSIIGLILSILSYAIISFIVGAAIS